MERIMKKRIKDNDLHRFANSLGLSIQHDCGGYRLAKNNSYIFPSSGICPTATKRELWTFLQGMSYERITSAFAEMSINPTIKL